MIKIHGREFPKAAEESKTMDIERCPVNTAFNLVIRSVGHPGFLASTVFLVPEACPGEPGAGWLCCLSPQACFTASQPEGRGEGEEERDSTLVLGQFVGT